MCSIKLDYLFPASLFTSNDPNTHAGYSSDDIYILKLLRVVLAVPTLKLVPSELVKEIDSKRSSGVRVPLIERMKPDPLQAKVS